jgi:arsenical pump membrane protein
VLQQQIATDCAVPALSGTGKVAALGIVAAALILLTMSAFGIRLGLPTAIAGISTAMAVLIRERKWPRKTIQGISWGVLPLVAGLFVLVEALSRAGMIRALSIVLESGARHSAALTASSAGVLIALADNCVNNLPAALIAGSAVASAQVPDSVTRAALIGVDLGPNLSVAGSLATILWLTALRREGLPVNSATFFKIGLLVMPPALLLSIGAAVWIY